MKRSWVPRPEDEFLHEQVGDPALAWKETWFVCGYDLTAGFALSLHMTITAGRAPDTRVAVAVRLGAEEALHVSLQDGVADERAFGTSLARLEVVRSTWGPDHELRLVGDLPECAVDLTFTGLHSGALWDTMFPGFYQTGAASSHRYGHAEQSLRCRGEVRWAGAAPVAVDGYGWRDRGWGRRSSTQSFSVGYDMADGVLPDGGVFTIMAFRNPDVAPDAPLPIGAWYADAGTLVPAVDGRFLKDSVGWPQQLDLTFADGRSLRSSLQRRRISIAVPFHDAAHDHVPVGHGIRDYFAEFADEHGRTFAVHANSGHMHLVNVTHDAAFVHDAVPA